MDQEKSGIHVLEGLWLNDWLKAWALNPSIWVGKGKQGDQIFAQWVNVYFELVFLKIVEVSHSLGYFLHG
jgi:hypothetical protein